MKSVEVGEAAVPGSEKPLPGLGARLLGRGSLGAAILAGYSEIFFLHSPRVGAAVLAATFLIPDAAMAGLCAVLAGHLFGRLLKLDRDTLSAGFNVYNPLLSGLAFGAHFCLTPVTVAASAVIGVLAFIATLTLNNVFAKPPRLPVLSMPFSALSVLVTLASARYAALPASVLRGVPEAALARSLPDWAAGFFRAMGGIVFLPEVQVGLALSIILLLSSRILLALAVAGYAVGTLAVAELTGSLAGALRDPNHFNFILVAMALGGIFMVPSPVAYGIAMLAVLVSTVFLQGLEAYLGEFGVPAFTLPFAATVLLFLYVLNLAVFSRLVRYGKSTPEETLDHDLFSRHRYAETATVLAPPFAGRWMVWQGFDGPWTHRGLWRYAYDFVIRGTDGRTHNGDGASLGDYHAYRKPVLAPLRGHVIRVIRNLPDNPVGTLDSADRWGNLVLIQGLSGIVVCLSHFAQDSITVNEGEWVEQGDRLGLCGNSGYSPQPHIHMQVQASALVGAASLPFTLCGYLRDGCHIAEGQPRMGDDIEPCFPDKGLEAVVTFVLGERHRFELFRRGGKVGEVTLDVKSALDGTHYFQSERGLLYFGIRHGTFYCFGMEGDDPALKMIFLALSRLPLVAKDVGVWRDKVPLRAMLPGPLREPLLLIASFIPAVAAITAELKWKDKRRAFGTASYPLLAIKRRLAVQLGANRGIDSIEIDDWELRRTDSEAGHS